MRDYDKPCVEYIELRAEESLASIGSFDSSTTIIMGNSSFKADQKFSDNWVNFWLNILRR